MEAMAYDYLKELNEQQLAAATHTGSPLLILAGAGSGKTKTLTYRAAYMVHSGKVAPEKLLLVTFTNKAAGEMRERVSKVAQMYLPNVGTFHSMAARILRRKAREVGLTPDFAIYDSQDQQDLVKEVMNELNMDVKRFKPSAILGAISSAKQELVTPAQYQGMARGSFQEMVADVYTRYQALLPKYGAVDFDDLMTYVVRLFREKPAILAEYQNMFEHIYVDEYQDTNTVQYQITKLLNGERDNLVVVGDASQSIYRWRGADYRNINKLKVDFPSITEIRLERNYRSTQNILTAASSVINHNTNHPILELWTDVGGGEKIGLIEAYSGSDEAAQVVAQMNKLTESGYTYNEIAILYRTNAQSRAFEEAMIRASIPYVLVGGTKFYERKEIKDLIAYTRLFVNPQDNVSRSRAEKNGKRKLAQYEAAVEPKRGTTLSPAELLDLILSSTNYLAGLDQEIEEDLARIENIKELQNVASEFSTVSEFLENIALVQAEYYAGEKSDHPKDCVTLMTLHAAKGLEYRAIFLVGLEEGIFPHARSLMDDEEMQEERRLMYVGITRAKERLFISHARMRNLYGSNNPASQSRFVQEIDPTIITMISSNTGNGVAHTKWAGESGGSVSAEYDDLFGVIKRNQEFAFPETTKRSGVRVDSLGDTTLDAFLSGEISVDELLNR